MNRRAFTLIEILIVLVILALLISISLSIFFKYKKNALVSYVQQNLVNCASSLMAEYADNGTLEKNCSIREAEGSCDLLVNEKGSYVKIATGYCVFSIHGIRVICEIRTNYGSVTGRIDCYDYE